MLRSPPGQGSTFNRLGVDATERFGDYRILRALGAGGMATTSLALRSEQGGFEQTVCLKRILPHLASDPEFVRAFLEEARLSAELRHGQLAAVIDFGVVDGTHFMALEYVQGCDLRQLLRATPRLDSELVSKLACDLATGLQYAHSRGVVHRDLSPSNVLLSDAGEIKLTDFGIAHALERTRMTQAGLVKGKVSYMAPEYAAKGTFDAKTDLFSLGVTLFEAATGVRPYRGKNEMEVLQRARDGEREAVPLDALPLALADAILACIDPDPAKRPNSAEAILRRLEFAAPAATARRTLAEAVAGVRAQKTMNDSATAVHEEAALPMPEVQRANSEEETRTRPVQGDGPTVGAPPRWEPKTERDHPMATSLADDIAPPARPRGVFVPRWILIFATVVVVLAMAGLIAIAMAG